MTSKVEDLFKVPAEELVKRSYWAALYLSNSGVSDNYLMIMGHPHIWCYRHGFSPNPTFTFIELRVALALLISRASRARSSVA